MANRQSIEERRLLQRYHARQSIRLYFGRDTETLSEWAHTHIVNTAPLIRWYETEYPKYLARKAKRAAR